MKKLKVLLLSGCLGFSLQASAGIAIIGNANLSLDSLSTKDAKAIFLCDRKYLADGQKVVFAYQAEGSAVRKEFNKSILAMKPTSIKRHWSKIKFTGACDQPKILEDDEAVRAWVKSTPGAIGYIDASHV
ncbi:MAG: hypothetical protein D6698_03635, partial [Gammaproteobacteria bacterium]